MRLQQWFDIKQGKLSKSSRKGLKSILSGIFERAIAWKLYPDDRNPVHQVKIWGDSDAREKRKLTDEQTRQFLAELPYDVRLLSSTCLFCGLRISEALALQEEHFDFERGLILIRQSYYRGVLKPRPKSDKGHRDLPMGYLKDDLRRMCMGDPKRFVFKIQTAPKWGREGSLCRDDRDLNQHFLRPAAKKLRIYYPGFGFRALRREAITQIGSVAGLGEAANAAGHTHVDTTLIYTLDNLGPREEAIKAFQERILGKPEGGVQ